MLLMLLHLFVGCASVRYDPTLYSYTNDWLDNAFLEENKISTAYYRNPDFTDIHASEPKYIKYPDEPKTRTFIITEKEEYDRIFTKSPVEVDFEKEMVILYTCTDVSPREYNLKKMDVNDGVLIAKIKLEHRNVNDSVMPYQRWFVLVMKKMEIGEVKFEEMR